MLIDLELEAGGKSYASEVCLLGGGIAGLVLAQRLGRSGVKVHLLEAGGLELEERSQALYAAEMAGDRYAGATEGRFRVFGGSSTRWGGQLLPYTEEIFRPGSAVPSAAWPIGPEAIEGYYGEVLKIMGVDELPFGTDLLTVLGRPAVEFGDGVRLRFSKWAPFGRRNLARSVGRECLASANVTVFTHANVMMAEGPEGRVVEVAVKNYAGVEFRFEAKQFVVCLGTIESSRLLLASGIGREYDQVGRYFHDHVGVRVAAIEGEARKQVLEQLGPFFLGGTLHTCKLEASVVVRERECLPAVMAHVVIEEPEDSGMAAVRETLRAVQGGDWKAPTRRSLGPMVRGIGDVAQLMWELKVRKRRAVSERAKVWLNIDMEQVARAEGRRIRLGETWDTLGQRRALLEWSIGEEERETARQYARVVKGALEAARFGPLQWVPGILGGEEELRMADTFHPMGGLRMGDDVQSSVVNQELRVHGVENLYVASCAVFPAGGSSNPTFTMMALALRLGDRLVGLMRG